MANRPLTHAKSETQYKHWFQRSAINTIDLFFIRTAKTLIIICTVNDGK